MIIEQKKYTESVREILDRRKKDNGNGLFVST